MRNLGRMRWLAALVPALVLGLLPLAPGAAACAAVTVEDEWASIAAPTWPEGPGEITAFTIVSNAPDTLYATNGTVLMRTDDGGCSWRDVFSLSLVPELDLPVSSLTARIVAIEVPDRAPARVTLLLAENVGPVVRPHVVVSEDGGTTWRSGEEGLPPATGGGLRLHSAPSDPDVVYLAARSSPAVGGVTFYRSSTGGLTWEERASSAFVTSDFIVDPLAPDDLWIFGASGVARSQNGAIGIASTTISGATPLATLVHRPGEAPMFMGYDPDGGTMVITPDGVIVGRIGAPPNFVLSMANNGSLDGIAASIHHGFSRFLPPRFWINVAREDQEDRPDIYDIVIDTTSSPSVFGRTPTSIERYKGMATVIDVASFGLGRPDIRQTVPSLTPADRTVKIRAGKSKTRSFRLRVPAESVGLDVFFLVDTTKSMQSSINGLRDGMQRVADELAASGIDVRFGVGDYKDYPIPGYGEPAAGDYAYRLRTKIGPVGPQLEVALEALQASGGDDIPESALTGLYQAATGEGEPPYEHPGIAQGLDAGFRPGALPVIVNVSDAPFHDSPAHPSPAFDTVASALSERGILQIGLAVFGPNGWRAAMASLGRMAEVTGTTAPAGGVDCDGDGVVDLISGAPLVCRIDDEASDGVLNLAPAIIATLKSLRRDIPVRLEVERGAGVVGSVDASATSVNVLAPDRVDFEVELTCPLSFTRSTETVEVAGIVKDEPIASARLRVVCLPVAPTEPEDLPPVPPVAPVAPVIAVVGVPPAPPGPLVQQIPAGQTNPAPQAGLASQKEEQLQVAAAGQRAVPEIEEELAFSSYRRRAEPDPMPSLVGAAGAMAMAAAWVALGRAEARVAPARRRR